MLLCSFLTHQENFSNLYKVRAWGINYLSPIWNQILVYQKIWKWLTFVLVWPHTLRRFPVRFLYVRKITMVHGKRDHQERLLILWSIQITIECMVTTTQPNLNYSETWSIRHVDFMKFYVNQLWRTLLTGDYHFHPMWTQKLQELFWIFRLKWDEKTLWDSSGWNNSNLFASYRVFDPIQTASLCPFQYFVKRIGKLFILISLECKIKLSAAQFLCYYAHF